MSRALGPTVEVLMRRVRQEGGLAVAPDFAMEIYTFCTQIINAFFRNVIGTTTFDVPKERLLFAYRDSGDGISDAIDICDIRDDSGVRIEKFTSLRNLSAYDPDFFRKVDGTAFEAWCQLKRDILILYPGQAAASTVDITYVKLLARYNDFEGQYNTNNELPDEDVEYAIELAEIVLLARFRQLGFIENKMKDFIALCKARKNDKS